MIQQRTGHRSLNVLCTYEQTTEEQELAVSKILTADKNIDYTHSLSSEQSKEGALNNHQLQQLSNLATWLQITCLSNCARNLKLSPLLPILLLFLAVLPIVLSMWTLDSPLLLLTFMARKNLTINFQMKWIELYQALTSNFDLLSAYIDWL